MEVTNMFNSNCASVPLVANIDGNSNNNGWGDGGMYYTEPTSTHTAESGYDRAKRMYTETKEMHKANTPEDKEHKMKSLDSYTKELASDITDMVADMSAEEKNLLRTKLSTLVSKI